MPHVPTLETARLHLRPVVSEDAPAIVALLSADPGGVAFTAAIPWPVTMNSTLAWIIGLSGGDERAWAIVCAESGALVGSVSLRGTGRVLHLGYWIGLPHRDQGYAREAAQAAIGHAGALGTWEVRADVMAGNGASMHVLDALGFHRLGDDDAAYPARGGTRNVHRYALALRRDS